MVSNLLEDDVNSIFSMEDAMNMAADTIKEGDIVTGTIMKINKNDVIVDIGYKSEGIILIHEFRYQEDLKIGKKIDVLIEELENKDGNVILSKVKADKIRNWTRALETYKEGDIVDGKIVRKVKGGLIVDIGMDAFLPASQIDIKPIGDIDAYLGKKFKFKVVKISLERKNVVVSRREFLEEQRATGRDKLLEEIQKGDIRNGIVKNITDFGAFVDLGGLDGLLHITDMSWGRINHPQDILKIGSHIEVMILDIDKSHNRVSLGIKQKTENPWIKILEKYPIDSKVRGKVVNLTNYGAFVELEEGIEGLVHISEMSWTKRINHPSEVVKLGDVGDVVILNINADDQKISLGLKQVAVNPWLLVEDKYKIGAKVKGALKNITDYGAFLELEEGIDGLIHISDMSWTKRINHPTELFQKGQIVNAVVLSVEPENKKISLGIKQLESDPWVKIKEQFSIGDEIKGSISKITKFGLFVLLDKNSVEGLIHYSQINISPDEKLEDKFKEGEKISAYILKIDSEERKLGLTLDPEKINEESSQDSDE